MNISIIGLGWLGLPLAEKLILNNHIIKGSTRSLEKQKTLQEKGFSCFQVNVNEQTIDGDIEGCLSNSDILILNTPPGLRRNPESNYVAKIETLLPYIKASSISKLLYVSSTSVFADGFPFPKITNNTLANAATNAGMQIRQVEKLLRANSTFETSILRFSGLVADDRHPARMMSKRTNIPNAEAPVNLIHRIDCIGIIKAIIQQSTWGITLNASYPEHPNKEEYYKTICKKMGYKTPDFNKTGSKSAKGKLIEDNYVTEKLNYTYQKPIW